MLRIPETPQSFVRVGTATRVECAGTLSTPRRASHGRGTLALPHTLMCALREFESPPSLIRALRESVSPASLILVLRVSESSPRFLGLRIARLSVGLGTLIARHLYLLMCELRESRSFN